MFDLYKEEIERIASEIEYLLINNSSTKTIFKYLDEELGKKLPSTLAGALKNRLIETWIEGTKITPSEQATKTATQSLPESIKWFEDSNQFDFGKIYNDYEKEIRQSILESLKGEDSISGSILAKVKKEFGNKMNEAQIFNRYRLVGENALNKAKNFSQILSYEELQIKKFTISAILDQKTSNICKILNGKTFETKIASSYVKEVLNTPPDKVVNKFPWADPKKYPSDISEIKSLTNSEIQKIYNDMAVKLPPFHAFCRTTVIIKTFTESKSIAEAESFAKENNLANKVNYEGLPLYVANSVNETLLDLKTKYDTTYDEIVSKEVKEVIIKKDGSKKDIYPIMQSNSKILIINKLFFLEKNFLDLQSVNDFVFSKFNEFVFDKRYWNSENFSQLVIHEFGHRLTSQKFSLLAKGLTEREKENLVSKRYVTSSYSQIDGKERLAEIFVLLEKGGELNEEFINIFKKFR